jgi:hypothetical protein
VVTLYTCIQAFGLNFSQDTLQDFCGFSQSLQANTGIVPGIRSWLLHCKSFSFYYSSVVLPFNAIQSKIQREVSHYQWFRGTFCLHFLPWRWRQIVPSKSPARWQGVTVQKTALHIFTSLKISNPLHRIRHMKLTTALHVCHCTCSWKETYLELNDIFVNIRICQCNSLLTTLSPYNDCSHNVTADQVSNFYCNKFLGRSTWCWNIS